MRFQLPREPLKYAILAVLLAGLITSIPATATPVAAAEQTSDDVPGVPASYYGNVTINGDPAPANTTIEAVVDGEVRGSITTDTAGQYGGPNASDDKLTVSGQFDQQGTEVVFYITTDGLKRGQANQTTTWNAGEINELNLTGNLASADTNGNGGTGGGIAPPPASTPPTLPTDQPEDNGSIDQSEQNTQPETDSSSGENSGSEQSEPSTTNQESEDETPGFGFIISIMSIMSATTILSKI